MRTGQRGTELACPSCGSGDFTVVKRTQWWGAPNLTLQCNVCPRRWNQPEPEAREEPVAQPSAVSRQPSGNGHTNGEGVPFHVLCCPKCGSEDTKVTSTRRPIRHHKCLKCGETFKSHEVKQ